MARNQDRIDHLENRVSAIEQGRFERIVGKAESIQLYKTMETAIKADPEDRGDPVTGSTSGSHQRV